MIINKTLYSLEEKINNATYNSTEIKYALYTSSLYLEYSNKVFNSMEKLNPNIEMNVFLLSQYILNLADKFPISEGEKEELLLIIENKLYIDYETLYKEKNINGYPTINKNYNKQIDKIDKIIKKTNWYYEIKKGISD